MPFASPLELYRQGVIGINRRNADFVYRLNPRARLPQVDDKRTTRAIAHRAGLNPPEHYTTVSAFHEIPAAVERMKEQGCCVIKPARGSGGRGILVISDTRTDSRGNSRFQKPGGGLLPEAAIRHHLSNLLSGLYSLRGRRDAAVVEELLRPDTLFGDINWRGVPDIRIVVVRGHPVMAMLRLPTLSSDGKANLHQGALGVGIDVAAGVLTRGVQYDRPVREHPDTLASFEGRRLPAWRDHLHQAARCYELTDLGYLGVDLVLDRERGPVLLEMNARPGLGIQIANGAGLAPRVAATERWPGGQESALQRVRRACDAFGAPASDLPG